MVPTDHVWLLSEGWICFVTSYGLSMQYEIIGTAALR